MKRIALFLTTALVPALTGCGDSVTGPETASDPTIEVGAASEGPGYTVRHTMARSLSGPGSTGPTSGGNAAGSSDSGSVSGASSDVACTSTCTGGDPHLPSVPEFDGDLSMPSGVGDATDSMVDALDGDLASGPAGGSALSSEGVDGRGSGASSGGSSAGTITLVTPVPVGRTRYGIRAWPVSIGGRPLTGG